MCGLCVCGCVAVTGVGVGVSVRAALTQRAMLALGGHWQDVNKALHSAIKFDKPAVVSQWPLLWHLLCGGLRQPCCCALLLLCADVLM